MVDAQEECYWLKLTEENQKYLKNLLWEVLKKEQVPAVRRVICELLGELAATIMNYKYTMEEGDQCSPEAITWDDLMVRIWELLSSDDNGLIEGALKIMGILFTFCMNDYAQFKSELVPMFKKTLEHSDHKIKASAIEAFTSFLKTADFQDGAHFNELMPLLFSGVIYILEKDEELVRERIFNIITC